jgi:hypothetical protein
MADQTTESILFEIKINGEQYKSEQKLIRDSLGQLALDIEKTRAAQKSLNEERKAGKLTDEQYARQSVALREQLKAQTADQRELEKGLATSQKAYNSAAGSAEQLRAQLFELTTAYYAMGEAERKSVEGQAIQKQALAVSDALKAIEGSVGSTGRNVGNYAASFKQGLAPIVAELVKIEQELKGVDAASEEGALLNQKRIGFMTAAQRAAAQAGITDFTQAKATIDQYTQAFTPAVENLRRVQQEQQQVGQTAGESSEQYQQLGFKIAGAQKALDDLVAKAGQPILPPEPINAAAGSLAGLRQQLIALKEQRETLDPTTKEAQELNTEILELDTRIQQASGKIDEFGERVQKNIKKENFDTVTDAVQGMVGAFSVATLVLGDNSDAAAAQAKALQLMTIAQNARAIAIGLDSAKDAAQIVLLKAKGLFLKEEATLTAAAAVSTETHAAVAGADAVAIEAQAGAAALNAEGQAASAEATAASTVATEAQVVVTGQATAAQRLLNVAMRLNPIGLLIIAVTALVGLFLAYRNASDKTQQKVKDFAEALLRFTTPAGLVYTLVEKLYNKFEAVRTVLNPIINGFNRVAGEVLSGARAFGEYIGLLDTAAEKASKLAAAELERAIAFREQADAEVKASALAGASARQTTQESITNIDRVIAKQQGANDKSALAHQKDLARIQERLAAGKTLSDSDKKISEDAQKAEVTLINLLNERSALLNEGIERDRAARQQEAQDVETNAARASQNLQRRLQQQAAADQAAAQRRLSYLDLQLSAVQKGTVQELELQQKKVRAQAELEIQQVRATLATQQRLRAQYLPAQLAALKQEQAQALEQAGLTEQQKTELTAEYAQKRVDLEQQYSLVAARQAVANIPVLRAQANAAQLKLEADFQRQVGALVLASQVEVNRAQLAQMSENSVARRELELRLINQEQELAIAGLDQRSMSTLDYETKVTAIRADAVAKRRALSEQDTQNVIAGLNEQQRGAELNQQRLLAGLMEGQQQRVLASEEYRREVIRAEGDFYAAGVAATKAGTTARENVEKQHGINLLNIERDSQQAQLTLLASKYEKISQLATQSISAISTVQDAASQQRLNQIDAEINAETTSAARKAVLEKQKTRIEAQAAEQRRKVAKAEAVVNLGAAILQILKSPAAPFVEPAASVVRGLEIAAATATAYAQFRAIDAQKFALGGIASGPSHAQGGIQLYHRGRHAGIEIEGGEPVLTAAVSRNPVLLGMASMINQLAGGRALAIGSNYLANGGLVGSLAEYLPQVRTGGVVQGLGTSQPIDYDLLTTKLTGAFTAAARALPPQSLNLTELRERNQQLTQRDAETNI